MIQIRDTFLAFQKVPFSLFSVINHIYFSIVLFPFFAIGNKANILLRVSFGGHLFSFLFSFLFLNSCLSRWAGLEHEDFLKAPLAILMCNQHSDPLPLDQTFCKLEAQIRDRGFSLRPSAALVKMFMSPLRWVPLFFYLTFQGGGQQSYICVGGNPNLFDHTSSVAAKIGSDPHGTF